MHDALFMNQRALDEASLAARAEKVGLSRGLFDNCLNGLGEVRVRQDEKSGQDLYLTATPTFFVGTIQPDGTVRVSNRIDGAKSLDAFQAVLDRLISGSQ
jgi:protein-disulfide isomerase